MIDDQAVLNRIWCHTLLEELTRSGVQHICIAPGSRSTPLTLEAHANAKLTIHTHFDERGLGFLALGLAKASQQPVAVIVTSGTAVANLLPAVVEAGLTREKLILLTADRPTELIGCGANQAIHQQGIFSSHVGGSLNLPSPNTSVPLNWLLTSLDSLLAKQSSVGGPVHINCPFPEPLYSNNSRELYQDYLTPISHWQISGERYSHTLYAHALRSGGVYSTTVKACDYIQRKGVVIVGSIGRSEALKAQQFAKAMGWPLFCDPQSGISSEWAHYDLWLQADVPTLLNQCDCVIQFGERIVSKRLNAWVKQQAQSFAPHQYLVISPDEHRINQDHLPQIHIVSAISDWIAQQSLPSVADTNIGWGDPLIELACHVDQLAKAQLINNDQLTELSVAVDLSTRITGKQLFLGNSLMVRLVDMLSALDDCSVFSNRGASGIDGLVATAAGVLRSNNQPMMLMIGDTSLLYDLNSLALLTHNSTPLVVVVSNNDGGAIFDLLPVPEQQKQSLYQMPHGYTFEHAAAQFQLQYAAPETLSGYQEAVEQHFTQGHGTLLIEVKTPAEQASTLLKQFNLMLKEAIA